MYAIVEIAGQQFKVEEGKKIFVHRLKAEDGKQIDFDKVLLIEDEGKITIGEPVIKDAKVEGKVLNNQVRGDKVIVFKKKRKKGYRIKNGHRQNLTQDEILSINGKTSPKKQSAKKVAVEAPADETIAEKKPQEKKAETKKPASRKEEAKKPESKKAAEKKPAAKKAESKKPAKGKEK